MAKAGENEKLFIKKMGVDKNDNPNIKGKLVFGNKKEVNISVDGHFVHNNKLFLVEIDSGNEAKILAGQYILLNLLYKEKKNLNISKNNCIFLVIHCFKNYNPKRTEKNFKLLKNKLNISIDFMVFHQEDISNWQELINKIDNNCK